MNKESESPLPLYSSRKVGLCLNDECVCSKIMWLYYVQLEGQCIIVDVESRL